MLCTCAPHAHGQGGGIMLMGNAGTEMGGTRGQVGARFARARASARARVCVWALARARVRACGRVRSRVRVFALAPARVSVRARLEALARRFELFERDEVPLNAAPVGVVEYLLHAGGAAAQARAVVLVEQALDQALALRVGKLVRPVDGRVLLRVRKRHGARRELVGEYADRVPVARYAVRLATLLGPAHLRSRNNASQSGACLCVCVHARVSVSECRKVRKVAGEVRECQGGLGGVLCALAGARA
eukprot:6196111-Pleurochrysis_carterae.AAC.2